MSDKIQHFLLVFDHEAGHLIEEQHFGEDGETAVAAYAAKEREYGGRDSIEIVLVGSDSLETVRLTHANYFDGSVAVSKSKYLAGI
ncbi:MAG TPA: hypothetical protein VMB72_00380 [Acidimicrobiales bacterium]|nr:hypothetical protein [Acidimicrobiales bacterium]